MQTQKQFQMKYSNYIAEHREPHCNKDIFTLCMNNENKQLLEGVS